jgi:DNA-3-methyladenine glycosylase II
MEMGAFEVGGGAIERAYGFDHPPTEDEVAGISDRWRPYRSLAVSYLFASEYDA